MGVETVVALAGPQFDAHVRKTHSLTRTYACTHTHTCTQTNKMKTDAFCGTL